MARPVITLSESGTEKYLSQYQAYPAQLSKISYLAENRETFKYLCELSGGHPVMLASFWDNLADDLGDFFSNVTDIAKNIPQWYAAANGIPTNAGLPPGYYPPQQQSINPNLLLGAGLILVLFMMKK